MHIFKCGFHQPTGCSWQHRSLFIGFFTDVSRPKGIGKHDPEGSGTRCRHEHKCTAVLTEDTGFVFFTCMLWAIPGYIKKNAPVCYAGQKNGALCLPVKLPACSIKLTDINCDANGGMKSHLWASLPLMYCHVMTQTLRKHKWCP